MKNGVSASNTSAEPTLFNPKLVPFKVERPLVQLRDSYCKHTHVRKRIGFSKNSEKYKTVRVLMSLAALSRQLRHLSAHSRALQHQRHAASTNAGGGGGAATVEKSLKKVPEAAMKPIQPQFWVAVQKTVRTSMLWGLGGPVLTIGLVDWLG